MTHSTAGALDLTLDECACLLRAARKAQQELETELYRLTEIAKVKGEPIHGLADTRELAVREFACISTATRKLWKVIREQPEPRTPNDG